MLRLGKHVVWPTTSSKQWRHLYLSPCYNLVSKGSVRESLSPPLENIATVEPAQKLNSDVDLRDTRNAYCSKGSSDLARAYIVFQLCSNNTLLQYQRQLLSFTRKVLGQRLFRRLMRMSIYGQFMAGQETEEILKVAHRHQLHGVRPMFAYTASEKHGAATETIGSSLTDDVLKTNYEAMQNSIELAKMARKYPSQHMKVTGKLTAISTADIFRSMTSVIDANTDLVNWALSSANNSQHAKNVLNHLENLVTSQTEEGITCIAKETGLHMPSNFRSLDWRSLTTCLVFHLALSRSNDLAAMLMNAGKDDIHHCRLSPEEETKLLMVWSRMDDLAERAKGAELCLIVDAEQTYLQSAMDLITLDLMRRYNKQRPVVHNTYQCYLKRTYDIITRDLASAKADGFHLGAKVVRGGYMDEERSLAAKQGYPDPVNPTFEATTAMYYRVAEELLQRHIGGTTVQATFATHNEETVKHILGLMKNHEVNVDPDIFSFAQLIGMRDHIAFVLGKSKFPAEKLLHYGDVEECVAYLSRRLVENRSGVPTAHIERRMLHTEIARRLRSGEFFRRKLKS